MALINRPLTEDEARKMLGDWRKSSQGQPIASFYTKYQKAMEEPTPHIVTYAEGRFYYTPPNEVLFGLSSYVGSPSNCTWIVPGTLDWKI